MKIRTPRLKTAQLYARVSDLCTLVEHLAQTIKTRDLALEQMRLERDRWKGHAEQFIIDHTPMIPVTARPKTRKR